MPHPARRLAHSDKKSIFAWVVYDYANSAFPTVISTFVFAAYFTKAVAPSETEGTFLLGNATAAAAFGVAVLSPILGAIADRSARLKPWLLSFSLATILITAALWTVEPDVSFAMRALILIALGTLTFELAGVFYNAMLVRLAPKEKLGRISGLGWAVGYAGGLSCLVASLFLFVQADPPPFGLDKDKVEHVRATALLVAVWFAIFSLPMLFLMKEQAPAASAKPPVSQSLSQLWQTVKSLRLSSPLGRFLLARMLYADGLTTLFAFGGVYAAGTFGMPFDEIILFGISLNVTAGLGAFAFGYIDDKVGSKETILIALGGLILFGVLALAAPDKLWFWVAGMALGLFMGPVQSASRTFMARLAGEKKQAEAFGLFAVSGKVTNFAGPLLLGWATLAFDSQRAGMATIILFLIAGALLLRGVRIDRADMGST